MTKTEFIEQALCLAVSRGMNDLNRVLSEAERAWTLLNPPPPKSLAGSGVDDEEKVLGVLRDGPVSAIERDVAPVRVRDVLLQAMRAKYGKAIQTVRLHNALRRLDANGLIRILPGRIELA